MTLRLSDRPRNRSPLPTRFQMRAIHLDSNRVMLHAFLAFVALLFRQICVGEEFAAEGRLAYQTFGLKGDVQADLSYEFTVSVKDCNWFIRTVPKKYVLFGKAHALRDYNIASSDSTNFYELTSIEGIVKAAGGKGNSFAGRIGPGSAPFGLSDPTLIVLWYAFASGCYFRDLRDTYINPATVLLKQETYAKDFRVLASWKLQDSVPFLPKSIILDGVSRSEARLDEKGDSAWHFTNCVYRVQEFGKIASLELPKMVIVQYFDRNPTNSAVLIPTGYIRIEATNYQKTVSIDSFRPIIPDRAALSDMRTIFSTTPFGIGVKGVVWPELQSSKKRADVLALSAKMRAANDSRKPNIVFVLLLVLLSISPIIVISYRRWGGNKRKEWPNI